MKLRERTLALALALCVAMSIPLSVVTAAPRGTGTAQVLTTNASGDNGHLRLNQKAKWVDKQKTEVEVTFKLETDKQMIKRSKRQDIVFVVDQSNSMYGARTEKVKNALRESTTTLIGDGLDNRLGMVQFGSDARVLSDLTKDAVAFNRAIGTLRADGLTYYSPGLAAAKQMLAARTDKSREAVIIFMSDGYAMDGDEALQVAVDRLRSDKVETYAVQYLSGSTILPGIRQVAGEEERAYNAEELDSILTVYREVLGDVIGAKAYTEMQLDIPVDTDNYTIVSGTSTNGKVSVSGNKAVWTAPKYPSGTSTEVTLRLKLKDTDLMGYLNNFAQTNLTYIDPTVEGTQTVPIDTTVLERVIYTLCFNGNANTDGETPDDMIVLGGTEISLPYNPKGLTKDGEVFTGWSLDSVKQSQTFMMPEKDTTLDAVWGNHEIELSTTTFAPLEPVPMAEGEIKSVVQGANAVRKVEFVDYIDNTKTVTDLSEAQNRSIGAWIDEGVLYLGCSKGPISAPPNSDYLFGSLRTVREINFNGWFRTDRVTNMYNMFGYGGAFKSLDLSSFDTSNVTDMDSMFGSAGSLTSVDLSSFDISNVSNMKSMFQACRSLTILDLSSFDMSKVENVDRMVSDCDVLKTIYVASEEDKYIVKGSRYFPSGVDVIVGKPTIKKAERAARLEKTPDTMIDADKSAADTSVEEDRKEEIPSAETDNSVDKKATDTDDPLDEKTTPSAEETIGDVALMSVKRNAATKATTRARVDPTLIDGGKIKQNDVVDYEITVKYHATAESRSNRIKVTNKMPEGMTYLEKSVIADAGATRIEDDGGKRSGKIENISVVNNVMTFDVVDLSEGAKIRVGYKTTATRTDNGSYYEFLNQASGTLQGLGKNSNFVSHHYGTPPANVYTLTYRYEAGSLAGAPAVPNPRDYAAGQVINLPTPSMPGYVFNGWKVDGNLVAGSYTMPANNVTLTGSWTQVDVTDTDIAADVTYQFDGDIPPGLTPPLGESYTVGTNADGTEDIWGVMVDIPDITAPDGYTFGGWISDEVSADDVTSGTFTLGKDPVVLKGKWTKNKYKVTYKYQNDLKDIPGDAPTLPAEETYEWGTAVNTAKAPQDTKVANFEGWMSDSDIESDFATSFTMPKEDVVLFGCWTKAPDLKVTYKYDDTKPKPSDAPTLSDDKGSEGDTKIAYAPTSTDIRDGKGNYGIWTLDKWTSPDLAGGVDAGDTYTMPGKDLELTGAWTFNIDQDYRQVKFKIENGKWADGKTAEIILPVKLVNGVATLDTAKVPTGMIANTGYDSGKWDVKPNTDKDAITGHVTYTYKFTRIPGGDIPSVTPTPDPDTPDKPDTPDDPEDPDTPNNPDDPDTPNKPNTPDEPNQKTDTPENPVDSGNPQTGDNNSLTSLIGLLGVSIAGLIVVMHKMKKIAKE